MNPTTKRSLNLYDCLSPKQLAVLLFEAAAEQDADEIGKIRGAVKWKQYNCIDAEFSDFRDAWHGVVMVWSNEVWRQLFLHSSLMNRLQRHRGEKVTKDSIQESETIIEKLEQQRGLQSALNKVMRDLCVEHGVNYNKVIKFTGTPERYNPLDAVDQAFYQQWFGDLSECLPAHA